MPKSTLGPRSGRVLQFLQGTADARIFKAMATRGFTQADIDEGWSRLRSASNARYGKQTLGPSNDIVVQVDAWENSWYPLVDATLRRRFPEIHAQVFLNLKQESGPTVLVSVGVFLDRIAVLEQATDKASKQARKLLAERGFTKEIVDEAKALLVAATVAEPPEEGPTPEEMQAARDIAEAEMWEWFREWSQIARLCVSDGRLLMQLGFLRPGRGRSAAEEEELEGELEQDAAGSAIAGAGGSANAGANVQGGGVMQPGQ